MKKLSNSYDTAKKFVQKATFSSTFSNFYLLIIVNKEKKILVCCQYGVRSKKAAEILENLGYNNVYNLKEGLENI